MSSGYYFFILTSIAFAKLMMITYSKKYTAIRLNMRYEVLGISTIKFAQLRGLLLFSSSDSSEFLSISGFWLSFCESMEEKSVSPAFTTVLSFYVDLLLFYVSSH